MFLHNAHYELKVQLGVSVSENTREEVGRSGSHHSLVR